MLFISMLIMGMIIGFIGIGGAGITIALLTVGFGVPIHTALAVALSAMVFTTMSGAYSHFKEGNVIPKTGAILGISGMIGAFMGANISNIIPSDILGKMSGSIMVLSAILLYTKVYDSDNNCYTTTMKAMNFEAGTIYNSRKVAIRDMTHTGLPVTIINTPGNKNITSKDTYIENTLMTILQTDITDEFCELMNMKVYREHLDDHSSDGHY